VLRMQLDLIYEEIDKKTEALIKDLRADGVIE